MKLLIKYCSFLIVLTLSISLISCGVMRDTDDGQKTNYASADVIATPDPETTGPENTQDTKDSTAPAVMPDGFYFNDYLGTSRENILSWLSSHENDDYYLNTPYGNPDLGFNTDTCMRPNGRFSDDGPCMTCTGFVIDVLTNSVKEDSAKENVLNKIENMVDECVDNGWMFDTPYYTDIVNSYFWAAFVEEFNDGEIVSRKFDTIEEMLASKSLRRGDIIYFSPDTTPYGIDAYGNPTDIYGNTIDSHIGFYWGDDFSGENLFWHSIDDWVVDCPLRIFEGGYNMISPLTTPSDYEYILVIPLK